LVSETCSSTIARKAIRSRGVINLGSLFLDVCLSRLPHPGAARTCKRLSLQQVGAQLLRQALPSFGPRILPGLMLMRFVRHRSCSLTLPLRLPTIHLAASEPSGNPYAIGHQGPSVRLTGRARSGTLTREDDLERPASQRAAWRSQGQPPRWWPGTKVAP